MKRRKFLQQSSLAGVSLFLAPKTTVSASSTLTASPTASASPTVSGSPTSPFAPFPVVRTAEGQRKFKSVAVENAIREVSENIGNKEIAWLFGNCFPNTLDTTVDFGTLNGKFGTLNGKPDTYVITGDIDAMWLRDSSAQVWPYLSFCKADKDLQQLIKGVIHRQAKCIIKDPYANAFYKDEHKISEWSHTDITDMKPGIHERKWEVDSLCYPIRLAHGYWEATGDASAFDTDWVEAMKKVLQTFREQQRKDGEGPYTFQRNTAWATDGVPLGGYGYPTKKIGLIHSMFRPSDDATIYPFLIPSNLFAVSSLHNLRTVLQTMKTEPDLANQCLALGNECFALENELVNALNEYAVFTHPVYGDVFAYEIDGFGNHTFMDDANVPSLLGLPYLQSAGFAGELSALNIDKKGYTLYQNTRRMVLSDSNPFFFKGSAGEGIGGPHAGLNMVWPLSIIMRGLTSRDPEEIRFCLGMLQRSNAGTGFMHESFNKDDASKFTRKWFAWANTLFGEFVWKVYKERPALLS
jgi:meiotically up-regulated gene 157 (Mug157) protein